MLGSKPVSSGTATSAFNLEPSLQPLFELIYSTGDDVRSHFNFD